MLQEIRAARHNGKTDEGFTLIELLIVIVILGVLAGIVVFGVAQFRSDSKSAACKADLKTVQVAADAYDASTGSYPTSVAQLVTAKFLTEAPTGSTYSFDAPNKKTSQASCTL